MMHHCVVDTCRFSRVVRGLSRFLLLWEVIRHSSFSFVWFLPLVASVASFSGWFCHGQIDLLFVLNLMILFVYLFVELMDPIVK